jgi:hypothetical protein
MLENWQYAAAGGDNQSWHSFLCIACNHDIIYLTQTANLWTHTLNLRLQGGVGTRFLFLQCEKPLKLRNIKSRKKTVHDLYGGLAGTARNEPKMWENRELRNLQIELYCI